MARIRRVALGIAYLALILLVSVHARPGTRSSQYCSNFIRISHVPPLTPANDDDAEDDGSADLDDSFDDRGDGEVDEPVARGPSGRSSRQSRGGRNQPDDIDDEELGSEDGPEGADSSDRTDPASSADDDLEAKDPIKAPVPAPTGKPTVDVKGPSAAVSSPGRNDIASGAADGSERQKRALAVDDDDLNLDNELSLGSEDDEASVDGSGKPGAFDSATSETGAETPLDLSSAQSALNEADSLIGPMFKRHAGEAPSPSSKAHSNWQTVDELSDATTPGAGNADGKIKPVLLDDDNLSSKLGLDAVLEHGRGYVTGCPVHSMLWCCQTVVANF